jgi:hypothetical protein
MKTATKKKTEKPVIATPAVIKAGQRFVWTRKLSSGNSIAVNLVCLNNNGDGRLRNFFLNAPTMQDLSEVTQWNPCMEAGIPITLERLWRNYAIINE